MPSGVGRPSQAGRRPGGRIALWGALFLSPFLLQKVLLKNFCSAMSPVSAATQGPALVSLFDLSADAPVLQGLSLVSRPSGEALAQALRASCPGIREGLGRTHEDRNGLELIARPGNTFLLIFPGLRALADISFYRIKFIFNSLSLRVVSPHRPPELFPNKSLVISYVWSCLQHCLQKTSEFLDTAKFNWFPIKSVVLNECKTFCFFTTLLCLWLFFLKFETNHTVIGNVSLKNGRLRSGFCS